MHGGSGGVGHIAVQLARYFGADVYSTGGGDAQIALIAKLGAVGIHYKTETVADYVTKHTDGKGFDLVYDSVGGENTINSFEATALNGQVATTVSMVELDMSVAHFKGGGYRCMWCLCYFPCCIITIVKRTLLFCEN